MNSIEYTLASAVIKKAMMSPMAKLDFRAVSSVMGVLDLLNTEIIDREKLTASLESARFDLVYDLNSKSTIWDSIVGNDRAALKFFDSLVVCIDDIVRSGEIKKGIRHPDGHLYRSFYGR
jgi:hypothetical protein